MPKSTRDQVKQIKSSSSGIKTRLEKIKEEVKKENSSITQNGKILSDDRFRRLIEQICPDHRNKSRKQLELMISSMCSSLKSLESEVAKLDKSMQELEDKLDNTESVLLSEILNFSKQSLSFRGK